jgi:hypothetical protein
MAALNAKKLDACIGGALAACLFIILGVCLYGNWRVKHGPAALAPQPFVLTVEQADGKTVKKWSDNGYDYIMVTRRTPTGTELLEFFVTRSPVP